MTLDLQAILRGLLKGMAVVEMRASSSGGASFLLEAPDGSRHTLELEAVPVAAAPTPGYTRNPAVAAEAVAAAAEQAPEPALPTVMAKKAPIDFTPTFRMIRSMAGWQKLPMEPKNTLSALEAAPLEPGDDDELVLGARRAIAGDTTVLRDLLQRRSPSARAGPAAAEAH